MRMDSATDGRRGYFVDADTMQPVRWVRWADLPDDGGPGDFEAFRFDPAKAEASGVDIRLIVYRGRARLRFIQTGVAPPKPKPTAAPPVPPRRGILLPPGGDEECEARGCHKRAVWYTHDVTEAEPTTGADGNLYQNTAPTVRHYFCDKCYRLPVRTSLRGVESEVQVTAARPLWKSL